MRFLRDTRTRAGFLVVCLGLIGGTGCITASIVNSAQQASRRHAEEERFKSDVEGYKAAAAKGDLAGMTQLGLIYLYKNVAVEPDIPKGMALLEQAAAAHYGLAEYVLGLILLQDTRIKLPIPADPMRGMELLKGAASKACRYNFNSSAVYLLEMPSQKIYLLYRYNRMVKDSKQETLWLGRGIIHCQSENAYSVRNRFMPAKNATSEDQTETLAWLQLLAPNTAGKDEVKKSLLLANPAMAEQKAAQLRQDVAESERQYPAPTQKQFVIKLSQPS